MTIAISALRHCLKAMGNMTVWQWKNPHDYPMVQTWLIVAEALDFPIADFGIEMIEGRYGIDFIERWLHENPEIHQPVGAEAVREERGRVLPEVPG